MRNSANTLVEAIESIVAQDFPHEMMEVVFVDDGSEDETLSVIRDHSTRIDSEVKIICTTWKGLGHARNLVISNALGKYVVWLDGDMIISTDFVRQLVDFMERAPQVAVAKGKQSLERGGNLLATLETYFRAAGRMFDYNSEKAHRRALGTGGSIYRTKAILSIGGFDESLSGYGEDWDAEIRMRNAGWSMSIVDVKFSDYERYGVTWKDLWKRYWIRGYHSHYFSHKNEGLIKLYRMSPPSAFLAGILQSNHLFKITNEKIVFFMPLQNVFRMTAWCVGFATAHLKSHQPKLK